MLRDAVIREDLRKRLCRGGGCHVGTVVVVGGRTGTQIYQRTCGTWSGTGGVVVRRKGERHGTLGQCMGLHGGLCKGSVRWHRGLREGVRRYGLWHHRLWWHHEAVGGGQVLLDTGVQGLHHCSLVRELAHHLGVSWVMQWNRHR